MHEKKNKREEVERAHTEGSSNFSSSSNLINPIELLKLAKNDVQMFLVKKHKGLSYWNIYLHIMTIRGQMYNDIQYITKIQDCVYHSNCEYPVSIFE